MVCERREISFYLQKLSWSEGGGVSGNLAGSWKVC